MHRRLLLPMLLLLLLAPTVHAADVSGKWTGALELKTAEAGVQSVAAHVELKQQGNSLSGKIWKEADQQFLIEQGKARGDEISFVFNAPEGEDEQILAHTVKLRAPNPF